MKVSLKPLRKILRHIHWPHAAIAALIVFFVCSGGLLLWAASLDIPDLEGVNERLVTQSTKIYDRTGQVLLYDLHRDVQRTVVPIDSVSRHVKNATVAIEDAEFYKHRGIKVTSTLRAILVNIAVFLHVGDYDFTQGGSTITQQVIKKALLVDEKLISRKIKEWVLALKLERSLPKDKILELYLNEAPYGGNIYGIEEASQSYFGKPSSDISLPEAAYLAALPQAPTYYSPYGNNREALEQRKNLVLERMFQNGFITAQERDEARATKIEFRPARETSIEAPHFVFFIREYLERTYGERAIQTGGLRIITTLDASLQQKAQEIVERHARENQEKYNASNAGLVAVDPTTGEILVMVGSRNYFDTEIPGNFNVTLASRQPGSAFKPFVYAAALAKGYTPETVVFDLKTQFSTLCAPTNFSKESPCFAPDNYDNTFRGPVTLRNALAQSMNVPSVKVLYLVGLQDSLRLAKAMGISTLGEADRYGLTLVLGGGEVRLLDLVSAYGSFATNGVHFAPASILRIEDVQGNVLERFSPRGSRVLSEEVAMQMNDILSDNAARTPAFGETSYLHFPGRDVAAKTGTTNDYRDAWIVGYTPNFAAGAWAGNNDNSSMEKRVAGFIVAPLWHEFMQEALKSRPVGTFMRAELSYDGLKPILRGVWQGGETYIVDSRTGILATTETPPEYREERVRQGVHSILHHVDRQNPLGPAPARPAQDPQYERWETSVRAWARANGFFQDPPQHSVTSPATEKFSLSSPQPGSSVSRSERVSILPAIPNSVSVSKIDYFVNGAFIGSATQKPFSLSFIPEAVAGASETLVIRASLLDTSGGLHEARSEVTVAQ